MSDKIELINSAETVSEQVLTRNPEDSTDSEIAELEEENTMTPKGARMATCLAEAILMNYFFPDVKDRKRQQVLKSQFMNDMQFNLGNGKVTRAAKKLLNRKYLVSTTNPLPNAFYLYRLK